MYDSHKVDHKFCSITIYWRPIDSEHIRGPKSHYVIDFTSSYLSQDETTHLKRGDHIQRYQRTFDGVGKTSELNSPPHSGGANDAQGSRVGVTLHLEDAAVKNGLTSGRVEIHSIMTFSHTFNFFLLSSGYRFKIYSANSLGTSWKYTEVSVQLVSKPVSVEAIHHGGPTYEVRWSTVESNRSHMPITGYTVVWCASSNPKVSRCSKPPESVQVAPKNEKEQTLIFNVSSDTNHHFGVSVLSGHSVSPITWASCLMMMNARAMRKLYKPSATVINSTSIMINWQLTCKIARNVLTEYQLTYCAVALDTDLCTSKQTTSSLSAKSRVFALTNLEPGTKYRLQLTARTKNDVGSESFVLEASTKCERNYAFLLYVAFSLFFAFISLLLLHFKCLKYKNILSLWRAEVELPFPFREDAPSTS